LARLVHAADEPKKNVLFLNSYHNGYAWSDTILDGARDTFHRSKKNIYLQIEYMDSKRYYAHEINDALFNYYKPKSGDSEK
jgi:two-component system cell cycle sensor histidine kinase/response regulator CckA